MPLTGSTRAFFAAACCAVLTPSAAWADASARAYLGDERLSGQVQPPFVHGPTAASAQVGTAAQAGYAFASANLDAGTLRAVGASVYAPPYTTEASATAAITDSLTFTGGTGMTAYLDYAFDGTLGVIADAIPKAAFAQLVVNIGTAGGSSTVYETLSAYAANCGFGTNCVVGTSTARTGSLAFTIYAGAPTSFAMSLSGSASIGNTFDFGHTAKFYLRVPDGVTYVSGSGSFLASAAPISAVPEPASAALLLAGVAAVVALPRRRSTAAC